MDREQTFEAIEPVDLGSLRADAPLPVEEDVPLEAVSDDLPDVIVEEGFSPPDVWDGLTAGLVASLVVHVWFFSTFSSLRFAEPEYLYAAPIETRIAHEIPEVVEPEEVLKFDLANPNDEDHELHEAINARSVGVVQSRDPKSESAPPLAVVDAQVTVADAPIYDIPEGLELDDRLVIKGTTGEALVQVEAALDRVSWEIANNLQEKRVLVAWLVDASGSLIEQRKIMVNRLRRIYGELDALESSGQIAQQEQPVLSGVVMFGSGTKFMTKDPTDDVSELIEAVEQGPTDTTGVENTFGAVRNVLERWQHYRTKQGRRIMVVIVTDEAGDDFTANLELAIKQAQRLGAKAYVVGPSAPFGRRQGFVPYTAPEDGRSYQLPVDLGPETAVAENVQVPFWFDGPQHEYLSSGLGPYALARLVQETGGVYFLSNMTTTTGLAPTGTFYAQDMRPFQPDYQFGSPDAYYRDLMKHPLRQAVVEAAERSLKYKALGTPDLELRVNAGNFLQTLNTAQQTVATSTLMIDNILAPFVGEGERAGNNRLALLEAEYAKETSPRWRAAYNLVLGRLLAQKVRCYEYNFACAQLKLMGGQDVATKSNHWIFRPDKELNYASSLRKQAQHAEMLLRRIQVEAPGTPWAVLAARELKDPLGLKVIERYIPPPPPPQERNEPTPTKKKGTLLLADDRPKTRPAPPAPPPKPPTLPKL